MVLASCSTPRISLSLKFTPGEVRVYRLQTTATTRIDVPGLRQTETTSLDATTSIRVTLVATDRVTLRVSVTATRFERDGRVVDPPEPQEADVTVDAAGDVTMVKPVGGAPVALGGSPEDLGALLGVPLRHGRVRVADRWRSTIVTDDGRTGHRSARVAALRVVGDYRCVVVSTATVRPVRRQRQGTSGALQLDGTETAATETAFAFDLGFPVLIDARVESRFAVEGAGPQGGSVIVRSTTSLRLIDRSTKGGAESPSPTATPTSKVPTSKTPTSRTPTATAKPTASGSPSR